MDSASNVPMASASRISNVKIISVQLNHSREIAVVLMPLSNGDKGD